MRLFFNLCIPCSLQISLSAFQDGLVLYSDQSSSSYCSVSLQQVLLQSVSYSRQHCLLFYGVLLTACIFPLASDSFSVHHYNTVIFLYLSVLLGLYCGWLHNPSGIKLVIDLILQFSSVAQITLQMTLYTSWN